MLSGSRLAPFRRERGGRRRFEGAPFLLGDLDQGGGTRRLVKETPIAALFTGRPLTLPCSNTNTTRGRRISTEKEEEENI